MTRGGDRLRVLESGVMKWIASVAVALATFLMSVLVLMITSSTEPDGMSLLMKSLLFALIAAVFTFMRVRAREKAKSEVAPAKAMTVKSEPKKKQIVQKPVPTPPSSQRPKKNLTDEQIESALSEVKAMSAALGAQYRNFGNRQSGLEFDQGLPLPDPQPRSLPDGRPIAHKPDYDLQQHLWPGGRSSFTFNGKLLPVAVYQHDWVSISRSRNDIKKDGYSWELKIPSVDSLLKETSPTIEIEDDGTFVVKFFHDTVVHSAGLTTHMYFIVDPARTKLEIQYYHHFDGE